ncbi:uncharacterized protein LOC122010306 isoform X1 [Zingiber officinale]|uniref:uncharacterized protein LOC122010306 isoform X1 n=1 Tax=Zingiber officinale TaxID=94328 RepID=UPI001C4D9181|nr:uncharacterized protein LOC122010306 isoform X1 [Zingiber officinale]XP_042422729.1 uncharacterized protein LOC122010306 isoform X1 [Zingiber officinale]XP_042422730.1 uncharacterized protein LOC122010306 isoform X1 [Zingiber officinale]XP_042422732.1 uncharacterized protein LOC122010306 isoform X1 [Zingiber officinale]
MASKSSFFTLLIFSALLFLSISQVDGAKIDGVRSASETDELGLWKGREMVEVTMDYQEPGANTNPRGGLPPPPSTP